MIKTMLFRGINDKINSIITHSIKFFVFLTIFFNEGRKKFLDFNLFQEITITNLIWIATFFLGITGIQISIFRLAINDKFRRPLLVAGLFFIVILIVELTCIYFGFGLIPAFLVFGYSCLLFLIFFSAIKSRDKKAIKFGEQYTRVTHTIDIQINHVLDQMITNGNTAETSKAIENGLCYILSEIVAYLKLDFTRHKSRLCILLTKKDGLFKVIAQIGIPNHLIDNLEHEFSYHQNIVSVAGLSANKHEVICIRNLSNKKDERTYCWHQLEPSEEKIGSIICYPIGKGVGDNKIEETSAVINISSSKKNAFNCEAVVELLDHFSQKIETLLYCYELINRNVRLDTN